MVESDAVSVFVHGRRLGDILHPKPVLVRAEDANNSVFAPFTSNIEHLLVPFRDIDALDVSIWHIFIIKIDSIKNNDIRAVRVGLGRVGKSYSL